MCNVCGQGRDEQIKEIMHVNLVLCISGDQGNMEFSFATELTDSLGRSKQTAFHFLIHLPGMKV